MSITRKHARVWLVILAIGLVVSLSGCPASEPDTTTDDTTTDDSSTDAASDADPDQSDVASSEETPPAAVKKAELLVDLPQETCNTPDAMCLLPDGNIILSMPNFNDDTVSPRLVKITPENQMEEILELPSHPDTEKPMGPLGICVEPGGDLFMADFQQTGERQSRVMRIKMEDGLPTEILPVIVGFRVSNAVIVRNGFLYVSETQIDIESKPSTSGVFRFKLEDLKEGVIEIGTPVADDPNLIATFETHDETLPLGADGLAFDDDGNLYVGNFAGAVVHKVTFDKDGGVASNEIFAKADFMKSADGLFFDPVSKKIYVADSRANAVQAVSLDGSVATLAQNGDTDGSDGGMDQPCEVLVRGRELIVSNMDWPVPGGINQTYNKPCTLSVIKLDE